MGVKASRLVAINKLKDLCGGGVEVPLTENDCFDKNDEIDEEKFEEYLIAIPAIGMTIARRLPGTVSSNVDEFNWLLQ
jgi:hypothetical protein